MRLSRCLQVASIALVSLAVTSARADGEASPPPLPPPSAAGGPTGPAVTMVGAAGPSGQAGTTTSVQAAPGSGGLTVVAPLAGGGSVTAVGCSSVTVNNHSTEVKPGSPCPVAPAPEPPRPRYARDSGRKAALITAPIVYGLGAMTTGMMYLAGKASCSWTSYEYSGSGTTYRRRDDDCDAAQSSLIAYGVISAAVPSIPRWVVGDVARAAVYTGLRGASIASAAVIDWGDSDDSWAGPFLFGFAAPVALAVVDMATTPHREDLNGDAKRDKDNDDAKEATAAQEAKQARARLTHVSPVAMGDRHSGSRGAGVALGGVF